MTDSLELALGEPHSCVVGRTAAVITIGGIISQTNLQVLLAAIAADHVSWDWDGPPPDVSDIVPGQPLTLVASHIAFGRFARIQACCEQIGLSYSRWAMGYPGSFPPMREVFTGSGKSESFLVDDEGMLILTLEIIRDLGTIPAIEAYATRAAYSPPPLHIADARNAEEVSHG